MADEPNEKILELIRDMGAAMKADFQAHCQKMDERYAALADSIGKKKKDAAGEGPSRGENDMRGNAEDDMRGPGERDMATRVAADDLRVANSALASLARDVSAMKKQMSTPMGDADAQAKADHVMRCLGVAGGAEPPMRGEDIVAYNIRLARKMQPHSKTWKGVDLRLIAADQKAFNVALDGIRADALAYSMSPGDAPLFQHRMITKQLPGGHTVREFVGRGTIFAQMSRPVRHIAYIGTRNLVQQSN